MCAMGWRAQHRSDQSFCEHTIPHDKGRMHGGRTQPRPNTCVRHLSPLRQVACAALISSFGFSPASQVFLFPQRSRISVPIAAQVVCLHTIGRAVFWIKTSNHCGADYVLPKLCRHCVQDTVACHLTNSIKVKTMLASLVAKIILCCFSTM